MLLICSSIPAAYAEETGGNQEAAQSENLVWQSITFGQSTDLNFTANVLPEKIGTNNAAPGKPGTIKYGRFYNFNPGKMVVENNTAFNNKRFNYVFLPWIGGNT
ncbi:hypothetical protein SAMN05444673_2309 [Bacillus sp. OV166]|uniref:hypothetical protein n=1 Tax=Bacillus sp. OV166 TaxID=1882763 RepID=UPI000A2AE59B|nr:hypothetical protein [Bacillus sp. OV166]SMQ72976.1 hypothetical protein SAMN05444673_2309 [Bacillus sp. OV166]